MPRLRVQAGPDSPLDVDRKGADRFDETRGVSEKGRVEHERDRKRDSQAQTRKDSGRDVRRGVVSLPRRPRRHPCKHRRRHSRAQDDERGFLGRVGETREHAGRQRPCHTGTLHVVSQRDQEREREEHEERFLDVEPAVVRQHRRERRQQRTGCYRLAPETSGQQRKQQDQARAEDGGYNAERPLIERRQSRLSANPGRRQRQVIQGWAVVIVPVVPILAGLDEHAELHRLVGLVVMHGPQVRSGQAERQRQRQHCHYQAAEDGPAHVSGVP